MQYAGIATAPAVPIHPPLTSMTLDELKKLKATWLAENKQFIDDARLVVETLGVPQKPYRQFANWRVFPKGNLNLVLNTSTQGFLSGPDEYQVAYYLVAMLGGQHKEGTPLAMITGDCVLHYTWFKFPNNEKTDNYIIPGVWQDQIRPHVSAAHRVLAAARAERQEAERQALLTQLLIGSIDRL